MEFVSDGEGNGVAYVLQDVVEFLAEFLPPRRVFLNDYGRILIFKSRVELEDALSVGVNQHKVTELDRTDFLERYTRSQGMKVGRLDPQGHVIIWVRTPPLLHK